MTHHYTPPIREMHFLLQALGYEEQVLPLDRYVATFDMETSLAILTTAAELSVKELLPLNEPGDRAGAQFDPKTQEVSTPDGFPHAYQTLKASGLFSACADPEHGGQGAPQPLAICTSELLASTNKSFSMCPQLTAGLAQAVQRHGTPEQKQTYLAALVSGEWTGALSLTESHAGSDLGLIQTRATPVEGDAYELSGTKTWITFGEHDLTENIVHLVLARLPNAPKGIRGVTAFLVPKVLSDGTRNAVFCTGLEEKMGIHASPTCIMAFEGATGFILGRPNGGIQPILTMMNIARLHVGLEGVALGEIAGQTALAFAKERRQGRSLNPRNSERDQPADPILVHPDVRRMLLDIRATTEPLRGLAVWLGVEHELSMHHPDEEVRREGADLVSLLTPVLKSYGSERGFANVNEAMQLCGGAGYTRDWHIEQYLRDVRIAMIYEGTNHIQALDLIGQKLGIDKGRLFRTFQGRVEILLARLQGREELSAVRTGLEETLELLSEITDELFGDRPTDPETAAAVASNYLEIFALCALSYIWCRLVEHAVDVEDERAGVRLKTARYFTSVLLPKTALLAHRIRLGKDPVMAFSTEEL